MHGNMAELPIIGAIKSKIDRLIADNEKLRQECLKLTKLKDRLRSENMELSAKVAQQQRRISVLELAEGLASTSVDKKQAKARVNNLMREVDKCIALLNK